MEIIVTAKTVEAAIALGAEKLGRDVSSVTHVVLEEPKKGLFGIGSSDAKVRVCAKDTAEELTLNFINTLIRNMGVDAEAKIVDVNESIPEGKNLLEKNICVEIISGSDKESRGLGVLIGHHGEVLDAIQYLANLAASKAPREESDERQYIKVSIDTENYRAKREAKLKELARRMANKALTYRRNMTLEPMAAYERRIIHSEIQNIRGVHTYSIGSDNDRRVVIAYGEAEAENNNDNDSSVNININASENSSEE